MNEQTKQDAMSKLLWLAEPHVTRDYRMMSFSEDDAKQILEHMNTLITGTRRERDKLLCEAIIATQYQHEKTGHLTCDVEGLLHHFNTHRPDTDPTLEVKP